MRNEAAIGDDLVGVHVRRGAGPALDDVHNELVVQRPAPDLGAGFDDRIGSLVVEQTQLAVGHGRRLFDAGQRDDQLGQCADRLTRDREVLDGAKGMDAVVGVARHFAFAKQVVLDARVRDVHGPSPS